MSNLFLVNADILTSVLTGWVDLKILGKVDTSICNVTDRPNFLSQLSRSTFVHSMYHDNNSDDFLEWILLRKIKLGHVELMREINFGILSLLYDQGCLKALKSLITEFSLSTRDILQPFSRQIETLYFSCGSDLSDDNFESFFSLFPTVKHLNIVSSGKVTTDLVCRCIAKCLPHLESFTDHFYMQLNDSSLMLILKKCKKLKSLKTLSSVLTPKMLIDIAPMMAKMTSIGFGYRSRVTNDVVIALSEHCGEKLQYLDVSGFNSQLSDASICAILNSCTNLKHLLMYSGEISDASLLVIGNKCRNNLLTLKLTLNTVITDVGLIALFRACHSLQSIDVSNCELISDLSINQLSLSCPSLTSINVDGCTHVSDFSLSNVINRCRKITNIEFGNTSATLSLLNHCVADTTSLHFVCADADDRDIEVIKCLTESTTTVAMDVESYTNTSVYKTIAGLCPHLHTLSSCYYKHIGDDVMQAFLQYCPMLRKIEMIHSDKMTSASMIGLAEKCPLITSLHIAAINHDTLVAFAALKPMLRKLSIERCEYNINDDTMTAVAQNCPYLEDIQLKKSQLLTDIAVNAIINHCHKLSTLKLSKIELLTNQTLEIIGKGNHRKLTFLTVKRCPLIKHAHIMHFLMNNQSLERFESQHGVVGRGYEVNHYASASINSDSEAEEEDE